MKKLSVIVPCYNAEQWIAETMESLLSQTYGNIEILAVDDGSLDATVEIVRSFAQRDARLRLIQQENAGVSAARNNGIDNASGEYIAFCDADDWLEPEAYEEMIALLEGEGSDIVFCEFERFWPSGKTQKTVEESFPKLKENPKDIFLFWSSTPARVEGDTLYTKDIHGASWRSVFKKDILLQNGIRFCPELRFAEDQIFVLNYLAYCDAISYIPRHFVHYRGHTKRWVYRNMYQNHMTLLREQLAILEKNEYYSKKRKKQIAGYLQCSAYFAILLPELMFRPDADKVIREYSRDASFRRLLTTYNFIQKYKARPQIARIGMFVLLKLRMFGLVKRLFKNKRY